MNSSALDAQRASGILGPGTGRKSRTAEPESHVGAADIPDGREAPTFTRSLSGPQLRIARREAGLSTLAVAERMGTGRRYVSQLEASARPTADAARRYLAALQVADADARLVRAAAELADAVEALPT